MTFIENITAGTETLESVWAMRNKRRITTGELQTFKVHLNTNGVKNTWCTLLKRRADGLMMFSQPLLTSQIWEELNSMLGLRVHLYQFQPVSFCSVTMIDELKYLTGHTKVFRDSVITWMKSPLPTHTMQYINMSNSLFQNKVKFRFSYLLVCSYLRPRNKV